MKKRHHVAIQLEQEKQYQKDNGPIELTADQLWKYSGKVEEFTKDYIVYDEAMIRSLKAVKPSNDNRKEYYRKYWQRYKVKAALEEELKKIEIKKI
jgi:hypothetical protein